MAEDPEILPILKAIVEAHAMPSPDSGSREPILYVRALQRSSLKHHARTDWPPVDDNLLEELHNEGLLDIDRLQHTWHIVPTPDGRALVERHARVMNTEPIADTQPILDAVAAQAAAENKLSWPVVRPVLAALHRYWEGAAFPPDGIQLLAVGQSLPEEHHDLFAATIRALAVAGYVTPTDTVLHIAGTPAEIIFTEKAFGALDGWPGAAPEELVKNLLAVLTAAANDDPDPDQRKRFKRVADAIEQIGTKTAAEILSKVLLGG